VARVLSAKVSKTPISPPSKGRGKQKAVEAEEEDKQDMLSDDETLAWIENNYGTVEVSCFPRRLSIYQWCYEARSVLSRRPLLLILLPSLRLLRLVRVRIKRRSRDIGYNSDSRV
jgi:hypothetical protein